MHMPKRTVSWQAAEPLKITVAPNGARRGRIDHPKLPITTEEIALTAKKCAHAGADEIHLHVREEDGAHSLDVGRYREAISAIATSAPDVTVQVTTETAGRYEVSEQLEVLETLRPRAASVSVREIARDPNLAPRVYAFAQEAKIQVQHILYDLHDLAILEDWHKQGVVSQYSCDVLLVLGRYAPPNPAQVSELIPFVEAAEQVADRWTVCAFGQSEHAVAEAAIKLGGHVRIGFENNICRPDGSLADDNAENIRRAVDAARALGRPLLKEVSAA